MQELDDAKFLKLAKEISKTSECIRENRQIGAAYVKNGKVIATGSNDMPPNIVKCKDRGGCIRTELGIKSGTMQEICYGNCAEMVALINACNAGESLEGSTLYCTHKPCARCTKVIIAAGIDRLVYMEDYPDKFSDGILDESGIKIKKINKI